MGLGLEDGKVAVCNEKRNRRGKNSVADNKWHMLAWYVATQICALVEYI